MLAKANSIVDKKIKDFENLRKLLDKNLGYIGQFTEYLFSENIPFSELCKLYKDILDLKHKDVNIDINNTVYEQVLDNIKSEKTTLTINKLLSQFPSIQKKLAKKIPYSVLYRISTKNNIKVFVSKISRYKNKTDLHNAMGVFLNSSDDNSKIDIIKKLKDIESNIIYDKDNILVVHVKSFKDMQLLGGDTSWCIATYKSQWNSYIHHNSNQFIIYDYNKEVFDPNFKIGFTLTNNKISDAYDIMDNDVLEYTRTLMRDNNIKVSNFDKPKPEQHLKSGDRIIHKEFGIGIFKGFFLNTKMLVVFTDLSRSVNRTDKFIKIGKLQSNTPIKEWLRVIPYMTEKEAILYGNKYNSYANTPSARITVLGAFLVRIIENKEYVSVDYMNDINPIYAEIFIYHEKIFNKNHLPKYRGTSSPIFKAILNGFWEDELIVNTFSYNILKYTIADHDITINIGRDNILKLYKKMNTIYNSGIYTQYSKYFEIALLIYSKYLNIELCGKLKANYDTILNDKENYIYLSYYRDLVFLPIDISTYGFLVKHTNMVIKKDYDNVCIKPYFGKKGYGYETKSHYKELIKFNNLIIHLEGYRLNLKIDQDQVKYFKDHLLQYTKYSMDKVFNSYGELFNKLEFFKLLCELAESKKCMVGHQVSSENKLVNIKIV